MSRSARALGVVTASAAAAAGAVVVARRQRRSHPSYVLELPEEAVTVRPGASSHPRVASVSQTEGGGGDRPTADDLDAAREQGRREGRRAVVRGVAGAVSMMSLGALITVLVLFAAGVFQPQGSPGVETSVGPPPAIAPVLPAPVEEAVAPPDVAEAAPAAVPISRPNPASIAIPAIDVSARVISLGLTGGALDVPEDFSQTGWWKDGPEPGEVGPAVIVGHVDSFEGPAVFFNLRNLEFGDAIVITRVDGSTATFEVRSSIQVDKGAFPTEEVYGATDNAALRLITCSGDFTDGSYLGNLIVLADLVEETPPPASGLQY